ncbi:hypothetical protein L3Q67_40350 [Saccharothrix sp. AJ9571]|nr:hypothetical protein L3Q67_40350 [Saccharothrix sp. AJ9571]
MNVLYSTLVVLHLVGMAGILGGVAGELIAKRTGVPTLVLHSSGLQVLTGAALVGIASSGLVAVEPNNVKAAVKLVIALVVLVIAFEAHKPDRLPRAGLPVVGALALLNVGVAVYW